MKWKRSAYSIIVIFLCLSSRAGLAIDCTHFWINEDGNLNPSFKSIGEDVGASPFKNNEGLYKCSLDLKSNSKYLYLYFGEIGDSSNVKITKNGKSFFFTHGSSPDRSTHQYLRFMPFWVEIRDFYSDEGRYEIEIYHKDLVPYQNGLRSGLPGVVDNYGIASRIIKDSPRMVLFNLLLLLSFFVSVYFLFFPGLRLALKFIFMIAGASSMFHYFQGTSVLRGLIDPLLAIKINDISSTFSYSFLTYCLFYFASSPSKHKNLRLRKSIAYFLIVLNLSVAAFDLNWNLYLKIWGISIFFAAPALQIYLAIQIKKQNLMWNFSKAPSKVWDYVPWINAITWTWDVFNLFFLDASQFFFHHYLNPWFNLALFSYWTALRGHSKGQFHLAVEEWEASMMKSLAKSNGHSNDLFNELLNGIAKIIGSNRMSFIEVEDNFIRMLGTSGDHNYSMNEMVKLEDSAHIKDLPLAIVSIMPTNNSKSSTEIIILPITTQGSKYFYACATDLTQRFITPFLRSQLPLLQAKLKILSELILRKKKNEDTETMLRLMRNHVSDIQLSSERYFIENSRMHPSPKGHALLIGDLAKSTFLNDHYGADKIRAIMEIFLNRVFGLSKKLGVILGFGKGDRVSILFPQLDYEDSCEKAVGRCYSIIEALSNAELDLNQIAAQNGVYHPVAFKFAACVIGATLQHQTDDKSFRGVDYLSDKEIDAASRVLDEVSSPGEIIMLESFNKEIATREKNAIELSSRRLKGKDNNQSLYVYMPKKVA